MLMCLLAGSIATATTVGLGIQAEGNAGSDIATDRVVTTGQLAGTLGLETMIERIALRAAYSPTLRFSETTGSAGALFNSLTASAGTRSGRWSIVATGSGTIGQQDFSPLTRSAVVDPSAGAIAPPPIDRLPPARFISVASASGQLALDYRSSTRARWGATVGAATSGGWGDEASRLLPRQRTVTLGFTSQWQADRLDSLSGSLSSALSTATLADGVSPDSSSRERTASIAAEIGWTRRFSPTTRGAAGVGVAATSNSGGQQGGAEQVLVVPTASGSLSHTVPLRAQTLALSAQVTMQPQRDPLTGLAYVQGAANGSITYSPIPWLTMTAAASGARVIGGAFDGEWGAIGEVSAGFQVSTRTQLRMGFREAATPQRATAAAVATSSAHVMQWSAFTGVSTGIREAF